MKKNYQKFSKKIALALAFSLGISSCVYAEALSEESQSLVQTAITLTDLSLADNTETIRSLLNLCLTGLNEGDPAAATIQSILILLDTGSADAASVTALLKSLVDEQTESEEAAEEEPEEETGAEQEEEPEIPEQEADVPEPTENTESEAEVIEEESVSAESEEEPEQRNYTSKSGLPIYEVSAFIRTIITAPVLVDVPKDWGNNASGRSLTSYSPVNDSGAISPSAGTLSINYFPMEADTEEDSFDLYEKNLKSLSVTQGMVSEDASAAELPARKLSYTMSVGANLFDCEALCFAYDGNLFTVQLMQGQQTELDYFPSYYQVVDSVEIGTSEQLEEIINGEDTIDEPDNEPEIISEPEEEEPVPDSGGADPTIPEETVSEPEEIRSESEGNPVENEEQDVHSEEVLGDGTEETMDSELSDFTYQIGTHIYQFPTPVRDVISEDLLLDSRLTLPYVYSSDQDMVDGTWTEIVNTEFYHFESSSFLEMIGVTNLSGYPIPMSDGVITVLLDTQGESLSLVLPGGISIGSAESEILKSFPAFENVPMNGTAGFIGNELLYARNVRDDGCNGYVLIRNDKPYYSAVSIICENGIVKEIKFECLGSERAAGVFLD